MDIQRFGQFSVHIKDKELISQIRTEYKMPLYNRETNMLVDRISDKAKEFFGDARNDYSLDKERRIPRFISEKRKKRARLKEEIKYLDLKPEKKHELAVKGGLIKRELEEIYESELGG